MLRREIAIGAVAMAVVITNSHLIFERVSVWRERISGILEGGLFG